MSSGEIQAIKRRAVADLAWVNGVLVTGGLLAAIIVVLKLLRLDQFEWDDIKFRVAHAWIIALCFTLAHLIAAIWFVLAAAALRSRGTPDDRHEVFETATAEGGLFARRLVARLTFEESPSGLRVYQMDWRDPTTWLAHLVGLMLMAAVIPFGGIGRIALLGRIAFAVALGLRNLVIGGWWVIALSLLPGEPTLSLSARQRRTRYYQAIAAEVRADEWRGGNGDHDRRGARAIRGRFASLAPQRPATARRLSGVSRSSIEPWGRIASKRPRQ